MAQPDFGQIMAQAQKMQSQLQEAQSELAVSTVTGQAGNGLVKVEMTGAGKVTGVDIKPEVVDPEDVETLEDLLLAALEDANTQLQELAEKKMGPLSQGLGLF